MTLSLETLSFMKDALPRLNIEIKEAEEIIQRFQGDLQRATASLEKETANRDSLVARRAAAQSAIQQAEDEARAPIA